MDVTSLWRCNDHTEVETRTFENTILWSLSRVLYVLHPAASPIKAELYISIPSLMLYCDKLNAYSALTRSLCR